MILSKKTLEKLRLLINEETENRSGRKLVEFFNNHGFSDSYGEGFPSRWMFTDDKLFQLNGTPEIDMCIKEVFAPVNFIGQLPVLDKHIKDFNQYLTFDKWKVVRNQAEIMLQQQEDVEIDSSISELESENEFLSREFNDVDVTNLGFDDSVVEVLQSRIKEIEMCFSAKAWLAVILLAGSTLEGILLGLAIDHPQQFNSSHSSPKDKDGKVKQFQAWSLSSFIDVARELDLILHDTQKFSHIVRDFRNYIHPFEQIKSKFTPREYTAKISLQVLKAAIYEMCNNIEKIHTSQ